MRNTNQRQVILEVLRDSYDHPNAYTIYERTRKRLPSISLGTVYRVLNYLEKKSEINKLRINDTYRFEGRKENHHHFICKKCHQLFDVFEEIKISTSLGGNKIDDYEITFTGICESCRKEENNGRTN